MAQLAIILPDNSLKYVSQGESHNFDASDLKIQLEYGVPEEVVFSVSFFDNGRIDFKVNKNIKINKKFTWFFAETTEEEFEILDFNVIFRIRWPYPITHLSIEQKFAVLEQCPICYEVPANQANLLQCSHSFCQNCIVKWLRQYDCCPLCREQVRTFKINGEMLIKKETMFLLNDVCPCCDMLLVGSATVSCICCDKNFHMFCVEFESSLCADCISSTDCYIEDLLEEDIEEELFSQSFI